MTRADIFDSIIILFGISELALLIMLLKVKSIGQNQPSILKAFVKSSKRKPIVNDDAKAYKEENDV